MNRLLLIFGIVVSYFVLSAGLGLAQESADKDADKKVDKSTEERGEEDELERCISINRIRSVEVLDNQRIIFRMAGGKSYLNILPRRCPGLRKRQPFMYRTSLSVLCDLDLITVLDQGGFGLRPMGSCGLGRFTPIPESGYDPIADDLKMDDSRMNDANE